MILYDHPRSSHAHKLRTCEKSLAFEQTLPADCGTGRRDTAFAPPTRAARFLP